MIVAICPGNYATGGPEALHQLVEMANTIEKDSAAICYLPFDSECKKHEAYSSYETPLISRAMIPQDAVIVIPEVFPELVLEFEQKCALWWLSVDNFPDGSEELLKLFDLHVTQSHYAKNEIARRYQLDSLMLSDYINYSFELNRRNPKKKVVLVNPAKGLGHIKNFRTLNPEIEVIFLEKMTRDEVYRELRDAMIYIDFGSHPGKDRFPREAVLQEVIVIARYAGAAKYFEDVGLPENYFFDTDNLIGLGKLVDEIFEDYKTHLESQSPYRQEVSKQKTTFTEEVRQFLAVSRKLTNDHLAIERAIKKREYRQSLTNVSRRFECPICCETSEKEPTHREDKACQCGATWRAQAGVLAILEGLGYSDEISHRDMKPDLSRVGLGISDDSMLARRLSQIFDYTNSYYHRFPVLDIMSPPEPSNEFFEFVSCSDVLEHTPPPTTAALKGIYKLLKPGGFAVLAVPCSDEMETREYYPGLSEWFIKDGVLYWWDQSGIQHRDETPEWHGGAGQTLTFRLWAFRDLVNKCEEVGFTHVYIPKNKPPLAGGIRTKNYGGLVIARR
jgi:hypothetical protein